MVDTIEKTKKEINNKFFLLFNNFYEESIGNNKINVMPTKDKIPEIKKIGYNTNEDTFEVIFAEYETNIGKKVTKKNVTFVEDKDGHLVAILIHQFSKMNAGTIRIEITKSIENEIKKVSMHLKIKDTNIPDSIVDKRKLMFIDEILKIDHVKLENLKSE